MKAKYWIPRPAGRMIAVASLFAVLQPALALEINNNAGTDLKAALKCGSGTHKLEIPAGQSEGFEGDPSDRCKYAITAKKGSLKCEGSVNAASGLQVSLKHGKLACQSYN